MGKCRRFSSHGYSFLLFSCLIFKMASLNLNSYIDWLGFADNVDSTSFLQSVLQITGDVVPSGPLLNQDFTILYDVQGRFDIIASVCCHFGKRTMVPSLLDNLSL